MQLKPNTPPEDPNNFSVIGQNQVQFYDKDTKKNKRPILPGILGIVAAAVIIGLVLTVLARSGKYKILKPFVNPDGELVLENRVENPLTGMLFSEEDAKSWAGQRPLAVMINNHLDARPQSGLVDADLVYEIVAEGGITRYLAFFMTNTPEKIGPVRSTREYYLVLVKELGDAMLMHIGWSPQALEAIETWPVRSLGRGGAAFWRDQDRINAGIAIEHTAYVNGKDLRVLGDNLGWEGVGDFTVYKFKDDGPVDTSQTCLVGECDKLITIDFWYKGDYTGMFSYDRTSNEYVRYSGYDSSDKPIPLLDQESKTPVKVKNLIVQFVREDSIAGDDKSRLTYELTGSGKAKLFIDGKAVPATWSKADRDSRTMFYDESGTEIAFNRGKFWISIVPDRNADQLVY